MDFHHSQGHRPFSTFGTGIGLGPNTFSAEQYGSRDLPQNNFEEVNIHSFADQIPNDAPRPTRITTRQLHHEIDIGHTDHTRTQRRSLTKSLVVPTFLLIAPITLLAAALLALVFAYKVQTAPDLFQPAGQESQGSSSHILVNFSATRLVFIASFLSSAAPLLTSFVMVLWTLPVAHSLRQASLQQDYAQLPTPYQLSLVIGLTLSSYERLWRYLAYLFSPTRSQIPKVVHRAAGMLIMTTCLALAVFGSDAALHFTTTTVPFDQLSNTPIPRFQYGRGLNALCSNFPRLQNYGLPCSYSFLGDPNAAAEVIESFRLQHNNSQSNELLTIKDESLAHGDMIVLAQQATATDNEVDYRASTIGVSSQCRPITSKCNLRSGTIDTFETFFNCTNEFWGIIGENPPVGNANLSKAVDPNIPGLAYKPAANLEYAFFNDSQLSLPYNTIGYNSSGDTAFPPLTDAELINPIYSAFAARIGWNYESPGHELNKDSEIFLPVDTQQYSDFILNCTITSYDINLTFINGSVRSMDFTPMKNGSILEIFHGIQFYSEFETSAPDLQDYLNQIALQNSSDTLARAWGNLYSQKIVSTIGGYMTPRLNLEEQQRRTILVASVSKAVLGALIACSLAYTVLGLVLCIVAMRSSAEEVRDLAAQISLAGLVATAFGDQNSVPSSAGTGGSTAMFDTKFTRQEKGPMGADGIQGFDFRAYV